MKTKDNDVTRRSRKQLLAIIVSAIIMIITCFITSKSQTSSNYEKKELLPKEKQSMQHKNYWNAIYIAINSVHLNAFAIEELPKPLIEVEEDTNILTKISSSTAQIQVQIKSNLLHYNSLLHKIKLETAANENLDTKVSNSTSKTENTLDEETPVEEETFIEESFEETLFEEDPFTEEDVVEEIETEETIAEWNGLILNSYNGVVDGPSGKESYYNLDMSEVINKMKNEEGIYYEYWIRDDGVKMYGDYVMCAANLSIRPKGTILQTSLGMAIVCDTGGFAVNEPYKLDIAVNW